MLPVCRKVFYEDKTPGLGTVVRDRAYPRPCVVGIGTVFERVERCKARVKENRESVVVEAGGKRLCYPRGVWEEVQRRVRKKESILLAGPPGTGKSELAQLIACSLGYHVVVLEAPRVLSKFVGESEQRLRRLLEEAEANEPSVILMDEAEELLVRRRLGGDNVYADVYHTLVNMLLRTMQRWSNEGREIIFVAATNASLSAIDRAFLRRGRFGRPVIVPPPSPDCIRRILEWHGKDPSDEEVAMLAGMGVSAADLADYAETGKLPVAPDTGLARLPGIRVKGFASLEYTRYSVATRSVLADIAIAGAIAASHDRPAVMVTSDKRVEEAFWLAEQLGAYLVVPRYLYQFERIIAEYRGPLIVVGRLVEDTFPLDSSTVINYVSAQELARLMCLFAGREPKSRITGYDTVWRVGLDCLRRLRRVGG